MILMIDNNAKKAEDPGSVHKESDPNRSKINKDYKDIKIE